jgi:phosphoribosyl 1,2-cyclic phosphodiesterase
VLHNFKQCHAVFLESNYDEAMLENGRYPIHLKNRIRGGEGHLSNKEALDLFITHRSPHLSHLILSHLSKENNSPQIAAQLFSTQAGNTKIIVASRHEASAVYNITNDAAQNIFTKPVPVQLGLFA